MESIEIILKKDSAGNDIHLNKMSLSASKSLREILDALITIVEFEKDLDLKIGIERGSAAQKLISDEVGHLDVVYNKILEASEGESTRENLYVNQLNVIYRNFKKFNDYGIYYNHDSKKEDIKPLFQRKFRNVRSRANLDNNFSVKFFKGILELNGGKKPNFHITANGLPYTVQCSKTEARKVNSFLYQEINISAWVKEKKNIIEYNFCDIYAGESEHYFDEFKSFFKDLKNKKGTEPFHFISEKLESYYNEKDYAGAKKLIRIFINSYSLPTYLRTILVVSKAFKEDENLKDLLLEVEKLLSTKIGKVY
jgi:hypothetical protein